MILNIEDYVTELRKQKGLNLCAYDEVFLLKRIEQRMSRLQIKTSQAYLEKLRKDPAEADHLLAAIGIKVSLFFRNPLVFEIIASRILTQLIEAKRINGSREIRIWSAGCSTGEEPYSIAILLHQLLREELGDWKLHIFATDINQNILNGVTGGLYHRDQLVDTRLGLVDRYFTPENEYYRLKEEVRRSVNFSVDDLSSTETTAPSVSIFGSFDLVLCRNVLIYFNVAAKRRAVRKMTRSLSSKGYLVLGESEWIDESLFGKFTELDHNNRIYRKK